MFCKTQENRAQLEIWVYVIFLCENDSDLIFQCEKKSYLRVYIDYILIKCRAGLR